jgi:hypothetical protein
MTYSTRDEDRPAPVANATRARQGRWGRNIFWVLVFGTLLAALGMFLAWTYRSGTHPGPVGRGQETVSGRTTDTPVLPGSPPPRTPAAAATAPEPR